MSKGRKAIPPALKDNATYKDVGSIRRQEEEYPLTNSARLVPPKDLTLGAKKEWRRVVKLYRTLNIAVLTDLDTATLASYCIEVDIRDKLYSQWVREQKSEVLSEDLTNRSRATMTASGQVTERTVGASKRSVVNPILREINRHNQTIRVLAEQLALTPAGRAAYAVRQEKANRSAAEEFMGDD